MVAFTGPAPHVKVDVNLKTLIGQSSGESYMFEFSEPDVSLEVKRPFCERTPTPIGVTP